MNVLASSRLIEIQPPWNVAIVNNFFATALQVFGIIWPVLFYVLLLYSTLLRKWKIMSYFFGKSENEKKE